MACETQSTNHGRSKCHSLQNFLFCFYFPFPYLLVAEALKEKLQTKIQQKL